MTCRSSTDNAGSCLTASAVDNAVPRSPPFPSKREALAYRYGSLASWGGRNGSRCRRLQEPRAHKRFVTISDTSRPLLSTPVDLLEVMPMLICWRFEYRGNARLT